MFIRDYYIDYHVESILQSWDKLYLVMVCNPLYAAGFGLLVLGIFLSIFIKDVGSFLVMSLVLILR